MKLVALGNMTLLCPHCGSATMRLMHPVEGADLQDSLILGNILAVKVKFDARCLCCGGVADIPESFNVREVA